MSKKALILLILVMEYCSLLPLYGAVGSVTVYNFDGSIATTTMTIQAGIDVCSDGGTVTCADGTYTGASNKNLSWSGKHITVRSVNGANNCIIDCENQGRGFYFNNTGQNSSDLIYGFTIKNGVANNGGGIYCDYSSPTITNCTILRNIIVLFGHRFLQIFTDHKERIKWVAVPYFEGGKNKQCCKNI
jgi:hypothetical protein